MISCVELNWIEQHIILHVRDIDRSDRDATAIKLQSGLSLMHASQLLLLLARSNPRMSSSPRGLISTPMGELETVSAAYASATYSVFNHRHVLAGTPLF